MFNTFPLRITEQCLEAQATADLIVVRCLLKCVKHGYLILFTVHFFPSLEVFKFINRMLAPFPLFHFD